MKQTIVILLEAIVAAAILWAIADELADRLGRRRWLVLAGVAAFLVAAVWISAHVILA